MGIDMAGYETRVGGGGPRFSRNASITRQSNIPWTILRGTCAKTKTHTHIRHLLTIDDTQLIHMWAIKPDGGPAIHLAMDNVGRKANTLSEELVVQETVHAITEVAKSDLSFFQVKTWLRAYLQK